MKRRALLALLLALSLPAWGDGLQRIRSSGTINLGYLADTAPFSSQQGDKVDGYSIELCRQLAGQLKSQLGLSELTPRFQALAHEQWQAAVQGGQVELFCTPEPASATLRQALDFSVPIYTGGLGVVVARDAPSSLLAVLNGETAHSGPKWRATLNRGLAKHSFAVVEGGVSEAWVRRQLSRLGVIATVISVPTYKAGVEAVQGGKADAFFSERMLLRQYLSQLPGGERMRVLDRVFEVVPVSLAMARGDQELRLQVDMALSELYHSGALLQTYRQYLGEPGEAEALLLKAYPLPRDR